MAQDFQKSWAISIYKKKILIIATDGLTKELCIGAYLVAKQVIQLNRRSGPLFTALYLKQLLAVSKRMQGSVAQFITSASLSDEVRIP